MIKRLVEKLYYKVFPDRINDHALAWMPIPIIKEERYRPEKIMTEVRIPRDLLVKNEPPIECSDDPFSLFCIYHGYIRFLREDE